MTVFSMLGSRRSRALFLAALAAVALLSLVSALYYAIPLDGIPRVEVKWMNSGWFYEDGGSLLPLPSLPCDLEFSDNTLHLVHDLSQLTQESEDILAIETRYQSIRVWADQELIYTAAQGREYALSSMWHFIYWDRYRGASTLQIELVKYDQSTQWELFPIVQDHPSSITLYLIHTHLPTILVWISAMLFTLMLMFIALFMAVRKIVGIPLILSLAGFIFLSGSWVLLDSKVTTVLGGNYALAYFFSYCVFYLLPIPFLFYFQIILEINNPVLRYLIWIAAGNAGLWMLLHLLGVVSIRNTATSVHIIIIASLVIFLREIFQKGRRGRTRLVYTLWGILFIFMAALASIILYHAGLLPPTNSAVLYAWGLLALILCMVMDTIIMFGHVWKEKQYLEIYRQLATEDSMTKLSNRNAYELRLQELVSYPAGEVSFVLFDIDRMKYINDTYGHHTGDQVISLTAQCIREAFVSAGDCYRIGGDEFCVILTSPCDIPERLLRFDELIRARNSNSFPISVSYGWEKRYFHTDRPISMGELMELKAASDQKLYLEKQLHAKR